jgi:ABC-2 type transport system permease protein
MRNVWLVIRREYREHVRTKAFIISTILMPVLMGGIMFLPARLAMRGGGERNVVLVTSSADFGRAVQENLTKRGERPGASKYRVEISLDASDAHRQQLRERVLRREIHAFVWATDEQLAAGTVQYAGRDVSDFIQTAVVQVAVTLAAMQHRLQQKGITAAEVDGLIREVKVETTRIEESGETKSSGRAMFLTTFLLVMMIYITVFMQGIAVMRSVLEEKSSRVVEVLLSALTAKELMAGKILGVGAVGLTQTLIWSLAAGLFSAPALLAAGPAMGGVTIEPRAIVAFIALYVLGYLLYATLYAALGAMVNTEQEAQSLQLLVMLPLILSTALIMPVLSSPSSTLAVTLSLIPFCTPILMYVRILVEQPPLWQLALAFALMVATIYLAIIVCSRIYRVGILMYGKRPTLPELAKWLRYA